MTALSKSHATPSFLNEAHQWGRELGIKACAIARAFATRPAKRLRKLGSLFGKLTELIATARDRILILPGAGITHSDIAKAAEKTAAIKCHSGLGTVLPYSRRDYHAW